MPPLSVIVLARRRSVGPLRHHDMSNGVTGSVRWSGLSCDSGKKHSSEPQAERNRVMQKKYDFGLDVHAGRSQCVAEADGEVRSLE